MPHQDLPDIRQSGINRLASSVAAIEPLFRDSWARSDGPPRATWPDRMGLVHQLDDRWNYVQQPHDRFVPRWDRSFAWIPPIPSPREISVAAIRALFPNLWAQNGQGPLPMAWYNGAQDYRVRDWPIADVEARPAGDDADDEYEDSDSDWDSEYEYEWESDSGIDSQSEASDDESCEDSFSDASSTSSMRQPRPNEYIRRLEEVEARAMYVYRGCPYCEWQIQYVYDFYRINNGPPPGVNRRGPW